MRNPIEQICTALAGSLQDGGNIILRFNNMCYAFTSLNNKRAISHIFFFLLQRLFEMDAETNKQINAQ